MSGRTRRITDERTDSSYQIQMTRSLVEGGGDRITRLRESYLESLDAGVSRLSAGFGGRAK